MSDFRFHISNHKFQVDSAAPALRNDGSIVGRGVLNKQLDMRGDDMARATTTTVRWSARRPCPGAFRARSTNGVRGARRGVVLLEVVVALSLLLVALAMIGAAFRNSDRNARRAVEQARAMMLSEQIITYFDTQQPQFKDEREVSGTFDVEGPPGWGWKVTVVDDVNVEGMKRVTVRIVDGDPDGSEDDQRPILVSHFLRAEPKNFNLQEDFGLTDQQIDDLTAAIPGGAAFFDPQDFDPTSLARLDMDTLTEILPMLMQAFAGVAGQMGGMGGGAGGNMTPEQLMQQMNQMNPQIGGGSGGATGGQVQSPGDSTGGGGNDGGPRGGRRGFGSRRSGGQQP